MNKIWIIISLTIFSLGLLTFWQLSKFNDAKMHVVFCDVGQGDAILIKTPDNKYILVDGGPDRSVVNCLAKHMPFWNRTIDLMVLTHPHADHFFGMYYVLERHHVRTFATENLINKTAAYKELLKILDAKSIPTLYALAGDQWDIGTVEIRVAGPTQSYLSQTSPGGTIGESKEFASLVLNVIYGEFSVLLTGDSQVVGLTDSRSQLELPIDVLHVPHHGSGTGLDEKILEDIGPSLAVISVGAENRYNHPHPRIMSILQSLQIEVLRTDQKGDIEIVSDGENWWMK